MMLREFMKDVRFGARLLRRSPGVTFTAVTLRAHRRAGLLPRRPGVSFAAVTSLALGIGGAPAVFSLVNAIVLRTLPVPDPQQLYQARSLAPGREDGHLFSAAAVAPAP